MTRLRVMATRPVTPSAEVVACLGADDGGVRHVWFATSAAQAQTGLQTEVPEESLFPCRPGASDDEMLELLSHWPAWRVTHLARLELGSRLLIVGGGWLAPRILEFARLWGCLWRAACGPGDLRDASDFWTERSDAETLRRILPAKPDAAILLGEAQIAPALAACQDKSTVVLALSGCPEVDLNLYPDAHRRSLRIVGCVPLIRRDVSDTEIAHGFNRVAALLASSALARG